MILTFNENLNKFKQIRNIFIFFNIALIILIKALIYNFSFASELNLLYIKNTLEPFILLFCTIYFIREKLIPLYYQM